MPVNTPCKEYVKKLTQWKTVRDCVEGEIEIKEGGTKYLPKPSGQSNDDYTVYKERAKFFDGTSRTAEGYHGHIFSKPPTQPSDVFEGIKNNLNDVDAAGTNIYQFASDIVWDCEMTGWGGILVDHISVPEGTTLAALKRGAYLKWYAAETIINWEYEVHNGIKRLALVVLREDRKEKRADDEFVFYSVESYRVLSFDENGNYIQRVFEKDKEGEFEVVDSITPKINNKPFDFIPFFTCPSESPDKSMLLGLAFENIGHYQKTADYENGLHFTGVPTPVAENMKQPMLEEGGKKVPAKVQLGGTTMQFFYGGEGVNVNVKYLEFSGAGLGQLLSALNSCLDRMAKLGIQAIGSEKKGVETAEVAQIHRASENGTLGAFARNMSDKMTQAVRLMLKWNGVPDAEADEWFFELNDTYNSSELSAQILSIMHSARQSGEIPVSVWFTALKKAGYIPDSITLDQFLLEIEHTQTGSHGPDGNDG